MQLASSRIHRSTRIDVRRRWRIASYALVVAWALALIPLEFWGLPSRNADELLFGGREPWSPEEFGAAKALRELDEHPGGADVDRNPHQKLTDFLVLNETREEQGERYWRYRLYSRQPDEQITFKALREIKPKAGKFDPDLYQYGGGYIYFVGAVFGAAHLAKLATITTDINYYLTNPEELARFYLVSRFLTLVFAVAALLAIGRLGRALADEPGRCFAIAVAALSPVFISCATEAKPHMPSAALALWSAVALVEYLSAGRPMAVFRAGALAGGAFAMVLTGLAAFIPIAGAAIVSGPRAEAAATHRALRRVDLLRALGLALLIFIVCNPFLIYNLVVQPKAIEGNISNSTAMYAGQMARAIEGAGRVLALLFESVGWLTPLVGVFGIGIVIVERGRAAWAAFGAAAAMFVLAILLGAGKPAEFARFLLLPSAALAIGAAVVLSRLVRVNLAGSIVALIFLVLTSRGAAYVTSLASDAWSANESRRAAGRYIAANASEFEAIGVTQDPAPYATPPIDFERRPVVLFPMTKPGTFGSRPLPNWLVLTTDSLSDVDEAWWRSSYDLAATFPPDARVSPISWANKLTLVFRRKDTPSAAEIGPPPPTPASQDQPALESTPPPPAASEPTQQPAPGPTSAPRRAVG